MTIPSTFQAHFLTENSRTKFIFFAEMYESYASAFQLFYEMNLEKNTTFQCETFCVSNQGKKNYGPPVVKWRSYTIIGHMVGRQISCSLFSWCLLLNIVFVVITSIKMSILWHSMTWSSGETISDGSAPLGNGLHTLIGNPPPLK